VPATEGSGAAEGSPRLWLAAGAAAALFAVVLAFWDPAAAAGPDLCLFHRLTGLSCPGCGLTRATALLVRGRLVESLALHPGAALIALETGAAWLLWGERLRSGRRLASGWAERAALATAGFLLLLWVIRWATGTLPV